MLVATSGGGGGGVCRALIAVSTLLLVAVPPRCLTAPTSLRHDANEHAAPASAAATDEDDNPSLVRSTYCTIVVCRL